MTRVLEREPLASQIDVIEDAKSAAQNESPWARLTLEQLIRRRDHALTQAVDLAIAGFLDEAYFYEGAVEEAQELIFERYEQSWPV